MQVVVGRHYCKFVKNYIIICFIAHFSYPLPPHIHSQNSTFFFNLLPQRTTFDVQTSSTLGSHIDQQLYYRSTLMSSAPTRTKRITKNHFLLTGNEKLYFKHDTEVSFRPARKKKLTNSRSIVPTFLNDRKFFTYAFQLPSELLDNDQEMLQDHHKRVRQATQEITQMFYPKPRSKNKYCGVCRGHYQDYKQHVQSEPHLNCLKKSTYQQQIVKFCQRMQTLFQRREHQEVKIIDLSTTEEYSEKNIEQYECTTASKSIIRDFN